MSKRQAMVRTSVGLAVLCGCSALGRAADWAGCSAAGEVDRTTVTIGDPIRYTLVVECPEGTRVVPPMDDASWAPFDVKDVRQAPPAALPGGRMRHAREYVLVSYETGTQMVPAVSVTGQDRSGSVQVRTAPIAITVASVNPSGVFDDVRPLKGPVSPGQSGWGWWAVGLTLCAAVAAGGSVWRIRRGRRRARVPPPPPWMAARDGLRQLAAEQCVERGLLKEQYERLGGILRAYLAARYQMIGDGRTTEELVEALRDRMDLSAVEQIRQFLVTCDLVKFARYAPSAAEAEEAMRAAQRIIDRTVPRQVAELVGDAGSP